MAEAPTGVRVPGGGRVTGGDREAPALRVEERSLPMEDFDAAVAEPLTPSTRSAWSLARSRSRSVPTGGLPIGGVAEEATDR